mgnify:CR=1 FL=1
MKTIKTIMENTKTTKFKTLPKLDLSNYTSKQKQSLQKGFEIWCSGCLSGDWEDEGFRNEYSNNLDWIFFNSVFGDWLLTKDYEEEVRNRHNILTNTFS